MNPGASPAIFIYPVILAAVLAVKRRQQMEEEQMSEYSETNSQEDWEYKILRANTAAFRKPQVLHNVCAEEKQGGWMLVEKFDDLRLRFRRPVSARKNDHMLGYDPYRTQYGMGQGSLVAMILLTVFGSIAFIVAIIILIAHH